MKQRAFASLQFESRKKPARRERLSGELHKDKRDEESHLHLTTSVPLSGVGLDEY